MDYDERRAAAYDSERAERAAEAGATADVVAELAGGGPVLELGVGTGRIAVPLAERGVKVTGIDASQAMVDRLRQKDPDGRIELVMGDFADPPALVTGPFTVVLVAISTLFELDDQEAQLRCLTGARAILADDGVVVIEAFAPDVTRLDQSLSVAGTTHGGVTLRAVRHDPLAQVVEGHDVVVDGSGTHLVPYRIRYATVPELDLMARLAGLRLRDRWGGWHRQPFDLASDRHVSVYERG